MFFIFCFALCMSVSGRIQSVILIIRLCVRLEMELGMVGLMPVIPTLERLREEHLGHTASLLRKNKPKPKRKEWRVNTHHLVCIIKMATNSQGKAVGENEASMLTFLSMLPGHYKQVTAGLCLDWPRAVVQARV